MASILVADDDPGVLGSIRSILEDEGHQVIAVDSGQKALDELNKRKPDLIILDIIMPEMSGLQVCRSIRANPVMSKIPILFLTAKSRTFDVAEGLNAGADDYLVKPFDIIELPARIKALLRRAPGGTLDVESNMLTVGDLRLHTNQPVVHIKERVVELTDVEHRLLHYLLFYAGQPALPQKLLEEVWQYPPQTGNPNLVHVHINNLRSKMGLSRDEAQYIHNIRGNGYVIYP